MAWLFIMNKDVTFLPFPVNYFTVLQHLHYIVWNGMVIWIKKNFEGSSHDLTKVKSWNLPEGIQEALKNLSEQQESWTRFLFSIVLTISLKLHQWTNLFSNPVFLVCYSSCYTHMKVGESVVRLEACRMGRWVASGIPVWVLLSGNCTCICGWCPLGTGCSCTRAGWGRGYRCADNRRSTAIVTTAGVFTKYVNNLIKVAWEWHWPLMST
jgi:hypothetical protein